MSRPRSPHAPPGMRVEYKGRDSKHLGRGASVGQEQKWAALAKRDRSGPTSEAIVRAVSMPIVGMAVRTTPSSARRAIWRRCSRRVRAGLASWVADSSTAPVIDSATASMRASALSICVSVKIGENQCQVQILGTVGQRSGVTHTGNKSTACPSASTTGRNF